MRLDIPVGKVAGVGVVGASHLDSCVNNYLNSLIFFKSVLQLLTGILHP